MVKSTNKASIQEITRKHDFRFKKELGQNFLTDENIARKIVDALQLTNEDCAVEVGPGMGSLTQILSEQAESVIAVELDTRAVNMLKDTLSHYPNVTVINQDFLKTDLNKLLEAPLKQGKTLKFISNLPYYITSPILMKLLESRLPFTSIVVMLQKEVAQRLSAKVNTKDYSSFTLAVEYFGETEQLFTVPKTVFVPMPKVDSAVIRITPRTEPIVQVDDETLYFSVVKAAFLNRRKMVFNSLVNGLHLDKEEIKAAMAQSGIDEKARAENITIQQFAQLANCLKQSTSM